MKKRWRILEYGIPFRKIEVLEKIFLACCVLHNMILTEGDRRDHKSRVGRGVAFNGDSIYIADAGDIEPPAACAVRRMRLTGGEREERLCQSIMNTVPASSNVAEGFDYCLACKQLNCFIDVIGNLIFT